MSDCRAQEISNNKINSPTSVSYSLRCPVFLRDKRTVHCLYVSGIPDSSLAQSLEETQGR